MSSGVRTQFTGPELFGADNFRIGDQVEFQSRGEYYLGEIVKKNRKKGVVQLSNGARWNVPYSCME